MVDVITQNIHPIESELQRWRGIIGSKYYEHLAMPGSSNNKNLASNTLDNSSYIDTIHDTSQRKYQLGKSLPIQLNIGKKTLG